MHLEFFLVYAFLLFGLVDSSVVKKTINNYNNYKFNKSKSVETTKRFNPMKNKEMGKDAKVVAVTADNTSFFSEKNLQVFTYLSLWYLFSGFYNTYNKKALNSLKLPWFVATVQMGMGVLIFFPLWALGLRARPASSMTGFKTLVKEMASVGFYQSLTHAAGVIALGSGAVTFTQVVKAAEPAFTAFMSAVFFNEFLPWQAYVALLPVMAGVAMSSVSELTFSWFCLGAGVMSNVFAG